MRVYGYGELFLVRSFEGRLTWTGLPLPEDFDTKEYYYEVAATIEM